MPRMACDTRLRKSGHGVRAVAGRCGARLARSVSQCLSRDRRRSAMCGRDVRKTCSRSSRGPGAAADRCAAAGCGSATRVIKNIGAGVGWAKSPVEADSNSALTRATLPTPSSGEVGQRGQRRMTVCANQPHCVRCAFAHPTGPTALHTPLPLRIVPRRERLVIRDEPKAFAGVGGDGSLRGHHID